MLLLADGRFPAGGHAHSGGLEEAVHAGRVRDEASLSSFLAGRLATVGRVDAALAVAAWVVAARLVAAAAAGPAADELLSLDEEAAARCPSPALRAASRAQGRGLLRASASIWPERAAVGGTASGLMFPVALGAVARIAGLAVGDVALVAAQASVSGPAWAATRLLGLDPFAVARCLVSLAGGTEKVASEAVDLGVPGGGPGRDASSLPAHGAPLVEIGAEHHASWEVRLFAS